MKIIKRLSNSRGGGDFGWLKTKHTFSFADYYDEDYLQFGCLRVINEDYIAPKNGFNKHPHQNYNIFSYIVEGELYHQDSFGNKETITKGNVQFTQAGTGIYHSEHNVDKEKTCHIVQIWCKPTKKGLSPSYSTSVLKEEDKNGKLLEILSKEKKENTIQINSDVNFYASILKMNEEVKFKIEKERKVYIHLIEGKKSKISINDKEFESGDGAFIFPDNDETLNNEITIKGLGDTNSEFLLFDLGE
jgi:quercetin 2,3-dioxygenase